MEVPAAAATNALIEVYADKLPHPDKVSIRANLAHVVEAVKTELQHIKDRAGLAIQSLDEANRYGGRFSDAHFHVDPAENQRLEFPSLKVSTRQWIINAAFQSAVELLNHPLEQARRVLAVWETKKRADRGESTRLDFEEKARWFHKQPIDKKMNWLRETYQFEVLAEAKEAALGLHRVRNCVVHRFGRVTPLDCNADGELHAIWEEYVVYASRPGQPERRVPIPGIIENGEIPVLRRGPKTRVYRDGATLTLTTQDLMEICHTVYLFASQVRDDLRHHGEARGLAFEGQMTEPRFGLR